MARMLSQIATIIRGSVGGLTFFAGPYHQIQVRARTAPVQPNTNFQSSIKAFFGAAVALWETISQADRDGWDQYAQTVTLQGPLGPYKPSGRDLAIGAYSGISFNRAWATGGVPAVVDMDPPVLAGQLAITNVLVGPPTAPGTGNSISFDNIGNGESIVVFVSKSFVQSQSRNYFKGPFRTNTLKSNIVVDAGSEAVEFVQAPAGSVYFARLRAYSAVSPFRMSPDIIVRCVSETTV